MAANAYYADGGVIPALSSYIDSVKRRAGLMASDLASNPRGALDLAATRAAEDFPEQAENPMNWLGGGLGMIAGVRAKTADLGQRKIAEALLKKGADPAEVWRQTGWHKGPDRQWRFEIPDAPAKLNMEAIQKASDAEDRLTEQAASRGESDFDPYRQYVKLHQVLDHPELFKAYPRIKDVDVRIASPDDLPMDVGAIYNPMSDEIHLNSEFLKGGPQERDTLLHEIQHAVQSRQERFPGGADPSKVSDDVYRRSYGEAEARNVEARSLFDAAQSRATPLTSTMDVPEAEAITKRRRGFGFSRKVNPFRPMSVDEVLSRAHDYTSALPSSDLEVLGHYTSPPGDSPFHAWDVNSALRSGKPLAPEMKEYVESLDSILKRAPRADAPFTVWRGQPVSAKNDPGFMSVSPHSSVGEAYAEPNNSVRAMMLDDYRAEYTKAMGAPPPNDQALVNWVADTRGDKIPSEFGNIKYRVPERSPLVAPDVNNWWGDEELVLPRGMRNDGVIGTARKLKLPTLDYADGGVVPALSSSLDRLRRRTKLMLSDLINSPKAAIDLAATRAAEDIPEQAANPVNWLGGGLGVIKPKGGQWLGTTPGGNLDAMLSGLKKQAGNYTDSDPADIIRQLKEKLAGQPSTSPEALASFNHHISRLEPLAASNAWVQSNLGNYIKNLMGTPEDPIRALAEQGITHVPSSALNMSNAAAIVNRQRTGRIHPDNPQIGARLGVSPEARAWENASDNAVIPKAAREADYIKDPWLSKTPPDTPVYNWRSSMYPGDLGFDHLVDVLNARVASGAIKPEKLNRVSVPDAVRMAHEDRLAAEKAMLLAKKAAQENMTLHSEHPSGYRIFQLDKPGQFAAESDEMGHSVRGYEPPRLGPRQTENSRDTHPDWVEASGDSGHPSYGLGGWDAIKSGKAKVYSVKDAKGNSVATIEVAGGKKLTPEDLPNSVRDQLVDFDGTQEEFEALVQKSLKDAEIKPRITQIKGKFNQPPVPEALPAIQDFIRKGQWADVGDLRNAGLLDVEREFKGTPYFEDLKNRLGKYTTPEEYEAWKSTPPEDFCDGGFVDRLRQAFKEGGAVNSQRTFAEQLQEALA